MVAIAIANAIITLSCYSVSLQKFYVKKKKKNENNFLPRKARLKQQLQRMSGACGLDEPSDHAHAICMSKLFTYLPFGLVFLFLSKFNVYYSFCLAR